MANSLISEISLNDNVGCYSHSYIYYHLGCVYLLKRRHACNLGVEFDNVAILEDDKCLMNDCETINFYSETKQNFTVMLLNDSLVDIYYYPLLSVVDTHIDLGDNDVTVIDFDRSGYFVLGLAVKSGYRRRRFCRLVNGEFHVYGYNTKEVSLINLLTDNKPRLAFNSL